jgi:hypothetical protein
VTHPVPEIAAEVQADIRQAEAADVAAGFRPYRWICSCGAAHSRGTINGVDHRCLRCGYIGPGGELEPPL